MSLYGIDNVRGASFCKINLTKGERDTLRGIISGIEGTCYKCGQKGHYANKCLVKLCNTSEILSEKCLPSCETQEPTTSQLRNEPVYKLCHRCGRTGHYSKVCVHKAITDNCYRCGRSDHSRITCTFIEHIDGTPISSNEDFCVIM